MCDRQIQNSTHFMDYERVISKSLNLFLGGNAVPNR